MNQSQSTAVATQPKKVPASVAFRKQAVAVANGLLRDWVGEKRAGEATGRIGVALSAAMASSKDPNSFAQCSLQSVGAVIATSALTGIMPGLGATALAYVTPRRIKGKWNLQYQLSHRGVNALAKRAGQTMIAIPISTKDEIAVDDSGECIIKARDFDHPPEEWDELRGICLVVKNLQTGNVITRGWVAKSLIEKRRAQSDAYNYAEEQNAKAIAENKSPWASSPWHDWPAEQAQKTAMHYAVSRGWCTIDDTEAVRALSQDVQSDLITVEAASVPRIPDKTSTQQLEDELFGASNDDTPESESHSPSQDSEPESQVAPDEEPEPASAYIHFRNELERKRTVKSKLEVLAKIEDSEELTKDEVSFLTERANRLIKEIQENAD